MPLAPGYGETPVPDDELDALLPVVRELLDKRRYIDLLRQYDRHRDPRDLAAFIEVHPLGE